MSQFAMKFIDDEYDYMQKTNTTTPFEPMWNDNNAWDNNEPSFSGEDSIDENVDPETSNQTITIDVPSENSTQMISSLAGEVPNSLVSLIFRGMDQRFSQMPSRY